MIRRIKVDANLRKFVDYCKKRFGDNLVAIVIFGSYAFGYFDKKKSDYDLFVLLKEEVNVDKKKIIGKFDKIVVHYLSSEEEMFHQDHFVHFTSYITLLKSGRAVYATKEYKKFLRKLKGLNLFESAVDVGAISAKTYFEIGALKKKRGFKAVKWALPAIRKRLQLLTFVRRRRLVWDLKKNLKLNRHVLDKSERDFVQDLDKRVMNRSEKFSREDREKAVEILEKVRDEIVRRLIGLRV